MIKRQTIRLFVLFKNSVYGLYLLLWFIFVPNSFARTAHTHTDSEIHPGQSLRIRLKKRFLRNEKFTNASTLIKKENSEYTLLPDDEEFFIPVLHPYVIHPQFKKTDSHLARHIIQAGSHVAILDQGDLTDEALEELSADERKMVRIIKGLPVVTRWVQNYLGFTRKDQNSRYTIFGYNLNQNDRVADDLVCQIVANKLKLPFEAVNLRLQGGAIIPLDKGKALVSHNLMHDNKHLAMLDIQSELERLGINEIIWTPGLVGEGSGHIDLGVAFINGYLVVPEIIEEALNFSAEPGIAREAKLGLDRVAEACSQSGYEVLRIAMPVTDTLNDRGILAYYTPVNWICVKGYTGQNAGKTTLLVPVPDNLRRDSGLIPFYQIRNQAIYDKLGVRPVFIGTSIPEWGGGFRCLAGRLPKDVLPI